MPYRLIRGSVARIILRHPRFVLGLVGVLIGGGVLFWSVWPRDTPAKAPDTCRELAEYLTRSGLNLRVARCIPSDLRQQEGIYLARVTPELASDWQIMNGYVGGNGVVRVMQYTSVLEARDSAASQFFPCFGYDRFVIDGDVDLLDDIGRHLH